MAPLPESNTPRMFIEYLQGGQEHVAVARFAAGSTLTEAISAYAVLAPAIAACISTADRVTGARYAAVGSNLSFPMNVSAQTGTHAQGNDQDRNPYFVSVTGRSNDGRKVRFTVFTQFALPEANGYKIVVPSGVFAALRNAVVGATADLRTISGQVPVWNSYMNVGSNSYFQRKGRRSIG